MPCDLRAERPVGLQSEVDAAIQTRIRAAGHWQGMVERDRVGSKMSILPDES